MVLSICDASRPTSLDLDSLAELSENDQIQDDGSCQQRVLTRVVQDNSVVAAHEDLGRVLIHCSLAVPHKWDVLDHHL